MNLPLRTVFLVTCLACTAPLLSAPPATAEAATRLQVFLDRANFGPGKIDGHYGGFTAKALTLYRQAKDLPPVASPERPLKPAAAETKEAKGQENEKASDEPKTEPALPLPDLQDMDLASIGPVFIDYEVTEADTENVGELPEKVPAMAKLKSLPYASLPEAVAEKFHCDLDYLKELNPGKIDSLKVGAKIRVPNVEPFEVAGVKDLPLLDQLAMTREDADKADDSETSNPKKPEGKAKNKPADKEDKKAGSKEAEPEITPASKIAVKVDTSDNMLRLFEAGKLVAAYPVTIGSEQTQSPRGDWKVRGIARLPDFRYDESFLKTGERGDKTYLLSPGPNNPVGVIWIATNRRGIGMHGTSDPDSIGRSASHGCVRLANWDIARLATRVRAGAAVSIH